MEGTAGRIIHPCFLQRDTFIYHIDNVDAIEQFLNKSLWDHLNMNKPNTCSLKQKRSFTLLFCCS